ncbi:tetratricopeptide repeat protein [Hypericibacter sp.]|uniref:tetratricopeptide repeat protein n=1 Tax=Hypericibacter sp. TaxID=2705401 RepID=UPI003D6C925A
MVEHSQSAGPAGVASPLGASIAGKLPEGFAVASNHLFAGRMKQAEAACLELVKAYPNSSKAFQMFGDVLQRTGRAEAAIVPFQRALELTPNFADAQLGLGNALYQLARYDAATAAFRRALALRSGFVEASHNLASSLRAQGKLAEAILQFEKTRELKPDWAVVHCNLGHALQAAGKHEQAAQSFQRALELKPELMEALNNLGLVLVDLGKPEEAEACYRRAITMKPAYVVPYNNLANLLAAQGRRKEAVAYYERALRIEPSMPEIHNNLGNAVKDLGQLDRAEACYRRSIELRPNFAAAHNNLGSVLQSKGKLEAARAAYRKALSIEPQFAEAYNNLGNTVRDMGRLQEAEDAYRQALALKPESYQALNNLATVLKDCGQLTEAIAVLRKAMAIRPDFETAHHNLLMAMQYDPETSPAELLAEHREFDRRFASPLMPAILRHRNQPDPERRLRVGYVSGDFARHPVGHFLMPLLPAHDRSQVEIFAYSDRLGEDEMTRQLRDACDQWRKVVDLTDIELTERIRTDAIDILVDLSGHTADNRLLVFARKPAPVQASWAGYVGTTGLSAIDYLISDERETPSGCENESVETVIRLPHGYVCYAPPTYAPEVGPLPAQEPGRVTFGCFNNLAKLNSAVIALWARVLSVLPEAKLVLKTHQLDDGRLRSRVTGQFAAAGVASGRVSLLGKSPHQGLLREYNHVDIALDPFPYSGGLTTLESLWMGVPVVTKQGDRFAARHTASHLTGVGLAELIGSDADGYVELAHSLAMDLPRLAELRRGLRARMAASPVCDGNEFARDLEAAYRGIWRRWCERQGASR